MAFFRLHSFLRGAALGVVSALSLSGCAQAENNVKAIACTTSGSGDQIPAGYADQLCESVAAASGLRVVNAGAEAADFKLHVTFRSGVVAHYVLNDVLQSRVITQGDIDVVDGQLGVAMLSHLPLIVSRSLSQP